MRNAVQKYFLRVRKFKRLLEFVAYNLFDSLVLLFSPRIKKPQAYVAVVNVQLLGDYFLWLPFGQAMVEHLRRQGKKVVIVGNSAWIDLVDSHFSGCLTVSIECRRMLRDLRYRAQCLRYLRSLCVEQTLNPNYPREAIVGDAVVRALGAPALGFDVGFEDRPQIDMVVSNRAYKNLLIKLPDMHQSARAVVFLRAVGVDDDVLPPDLPAVELASKFVDQLDGRTFFLVIPGASRAFKQWPADKMTEVARRLLATDANVICVIAGTVTEMALCRSIATALPEGRAMDLGGHTNLLDFIALVAHAQCVLCNDSAAGHIAAMYGVPSVVVLGGEAYGCCYPYPDQAPIRCDPVCISHKMPCFGCNLVCAYGVSPGLAYPCIELVDVDLVWSAVLSIMSPGSC